MRSGTPSSQFCRAAVLCVLCAAWLRAASLTGLATGADLIVMGAVTARDESPTEVSFDINVERVFKGDASLRVAHVYHQWARKGVLINAPPTIVAQLHGIWFLQRTASSDWDVLVARSPDGITGSLFWSVPSTLPTFYQSLPSTSLVDTLTIEKAASIDSGGLRPEEMIGATGSLNTPALQAVFAHFLHSPSTAFQAAGLAGMLSGGQSESIGTLVQVWPSINTDPTRRYVISALRDGFRDLSPSAVLGLVQLAGAGSTTAEVRTAAVWALAAIHTREALPFLASLLLSPDPAEQSRGVFGLSSFANGCPAQTRDNVVSMEYLLFKSPSPYRTSETIANFAFGGNPAAGDPALSRLVSYWLGWWTSHPEIH